MRLVYPAADIVPQAHVHGVLVAAALHDVEGRDRQYAGEDAGQRLLERGVAVRRPEDDGPAGPQGEQRELHAGLGIEVGIGLAHQPVGAVVGVERDQVEPLRTSGQHIGHVRDLDGGAPGGAVVFWSPDRYAAFEQSLAGVFARVLPVAAFDVVQGRRHEYTMYVGLRDDVRGGVD